MLVGYADQCENHDFATEKRVGFKIIKNCNKISLSREISLGKFNFESARSNFHRGDGNSSRTTSLHTLINSPLAVVDL